MVLRSDHVAGAAFVAFGILIFALSGDLPTGRLSMPGAGFLPKLIAGLTIILGLALFSRARESAPFSEIDWSDGKHAVMVTAVTAATIAFYTVLGFIITLVLMIFVALTIIERRNPLRAAAYSLSLVLFTYVSFEYLLRTPLPYSPFGF